MATASGGQKLSAELQRLSGQLATGDAVRVGFLENATYPDGTPVAMIGAIQEFGAPSVGIPSRPYFRNMIAAKSGEWGEAIAGLLRSNGFNARRVLELTGAAIAGQLRQSIRDTNSPPLAASTIRRKGFDKPLIETSHLINSVDYEVQTRT